MKLGTLPYTHTHDSFLYVTNVTNVTIKAILGSTRGTDALHILQSIQDGILTGMSVECVISNREKSK